MPTFLGMLWRPLGLTLSLPRDRMQDAGSQMEPPEIYEVVEQS